jgi:peptidoglycan hydrolase CwlO-like protein
MNRRLERDVFDYCAETCPAVESAFTDLTQSMEPLVASSCWADAEDAIRSALKTVKEVGTERLRDALRSAVSDKLDAESEVESAKREIADLKSEIDALRNEIKEEAA